MSLIQPRNKDKNTAVDCSIIIPVYNCLEYTRACLEALFEDRSRTSFEIIVIDNGSSDETPVFLASLTDKLTVLSPGENLGFSRANNLGAHRASGRYLVLLNNDTVPEAGWLDAMLETAESDPRIAVVGAKLLYPEDRLVQHAGVVLTDDLKLMHIYENFPEDHPAVNKRRDFSIVTAACMLVRREIYLRAGGLDERFVNGFEDVDFCLKVIEAGLRVVYEPGATVLHHTEKTAGRKEHEDANAILLTQLWRHKLTSNINKYLIEDGYTINRKGGAVLIVPEGVNMVELQDKARETLKEGKISEALELYEELHQLDPNNATALVYLADIHTRRGDLDKAATMLLRLSRTHPSGEVFIKLAQNSLQRRQYEGARRYAQEAVNVSASTNGNTDEARAILADASYKTGDTEGAAQHYDVVLSSNPNHIRSLIGRGTIALTLKDNQKALDFFDRALTVNPHQERAILGKGLAYLALKRSRDDASLIA